MERVCKECGSLVNGEAKFCPVCGKVMERAVELGKQQADVMPPQASQTQNTAPAVLNVPAQPTQTGNEVGSSAGYGAPQYGSGGVPQNISPVPVNYMTTGEWVLTIIVGSFFGIISLILNIVWGFGTDTPEPKRSFCRAMFIVNIIQLVLGFILGFIFMAIAISEGFSSVYY